MEGVEDLGKENVRNVIVNGNWVGCSYKEFLACNPKEYDGKGGDVVLTRWIEKMEYVHDMSGCSIDQKVKYTAGSFVGKALTWWNSQIHTLSREVSISMSWNDFKFMMIQEFYPSHEMKKLESELWNHAMVGAGHAAYTNRFHELARLVPHLVTLESRMIKRYVYGLATQIRRMVAAIEPKTRQKVVQISGALTDEAVRNGSNKKVEKRGNVGKPSKYKKWSACPKLNRAQGPEENHPNQVAANTRASLVEIDEVIRIVKLEIEGHVFDIDLITLLGMGVFDVIIGMDWLSNHKAKIICHEKVVRITTERWQVLRVLGERGPEKKARLLLSAKASDKKQVEIVVIELIPRVVPFAKSPYRLIPSELEELSGQLKELQDKGADKMYYDLRDRYWWPGMKKDIAEYVNFEERHAIERASCTLEEVGCSNFPVVVEFSYSKYYHYNGDVLCLWRLWRKCRSLIIVAAVKKDRLKAARDRQKSYADKRRKPLDFSIGDYVLLKVSLWKGVVRFGKKGKLAPRFVRPFEIVKKVDSVAYQLDLPEELNGVHDTFHVSNLKKCLADPTLQVPFG
ncbi:reverse transcriptase domain-containing protein [Tanacetum coccineum]